MTRPGDEAHVELGQRPFGAWLLPGHPRIPGPSQRPVRDSADRLNLSHLLADDRIGVPTGPLGLGLNQVRSARPLRIPLIGLEVLPALGPRLIDRRPAVLGEAGALGRHRRALVHQGGEGHSPPFALIADEVGVRHAGVGQEHLVERCMAVHLMQGSDIDTGLLHREREVRDALVFGDIPVGAGHQDSERRLVRPRVPHLLPVHDPFVAVAIGPGGEPGEVRAASRFAEQLTPLVFTSEDRPQEPLLHVIRAVSENRRCDEVHADTSSDTDCANGVELVCHDRFHRGRQAAAVPFLWPTRRAPTAVSQLAPPLEERHVPVPVLFEPGAGFVTNVGGVNHGATVGGARLRPAKRPGPHPGSVQAPGP